MRVEYVKGFSDALETVLTIFNRCGLKGKLPPSCKNCVVIEEINKILTLVKDRQFEKLQEDLGYVFL